MPFSASSSAAAGGTRGPRGRLARLLPALLLLALATVSLAAQEEEEDLTAGIAALNAHLNRGRELFQSLKFPEAIVEFNYVVDQYQGGKLQEMDAGVLQKVAEALDLRARSYFNQGDRDHAREDFAKLLRVKIDYQIDEKMVSPKVIDLFKEVRKQNVGSLAIVSNPSAAEAFLGDESLGMTPILGRATMQGTYRLRLVKAGYDEYQEEITVLPRTELKKEIRLRPNARTLQFITQPAGVNVYLDDQKVGTTFAGPLVPELQALAKDAGLDPTKASAPLLVPGVKDGNHVVRFEKECYEPNPRTISVTLDLEENKPQTFTPVLMKENRGVLQVVSHPSGADLFVDAETTPRGATPLQQVSVCAGEREIRLVKEGAGRWFARVRIQANTVNTLDARLRPTLLYLGTFRLDSWGRLNWSDEDKLLQEGMKSLGSVSQVRPSADLTAFREALLTEMAPKDEAEKVSKGKGIPPARVVEALTKFQADLLMVVFSVENGGKATSTLFLYSSEQPEPDRVEVNLSRQDTVRALLDRFDRVPEQRRPWFGAAIADTLLSEGAVVVRVVKGGPAAAAGLLPGDLVLSCNNRRVASASHLAAGGEWKVDDKVVFGIKRDGPVQNVTVTMGSTPVLLPLNSPEILYNKALCDYRQISRGGDDPMERSLALVNLGIALMHFRAYDKALAEGFNLANLPAGPGISRGTVRYYQGLCYLKKEMVPEARTAFKDAMAAADATLESNDGPPVAPRAGKLLK